MLSDPKFLYGAPKEKRRFHTDVQGEGTKLYFESDDYRKAIALRVNVNGTDKFEAVKVALAEAGFSFEDTSRPKDAEKGKFRAVITLPSDEVLHIDATPEAYGAFLATLGKLQETLHLEADGCERVAKETELAFRRLAIEAAKQEPAIRELLRKDEEGYWSESRQDHSHFVATTDYHQEGLSAVEARVDEALEKAKRIAGQKSGAEVDPAEGGIAGKESKARGV